MGVIKDGTISGVVPEPGGFLVHYPAYPSSISRAVDTLGGIQGILKARSSQSNKLELRFRPEDPYSHPAFGELRPTNTLLLKISKRKSPCVREAEEASSSSGVKNGEQENQPESERKQEESLCADIVARVTDAYFFDGMADYQHVIPVHADVARRKKRNSSELEEPLFDKGGFMDPDHEDVMIIVPPIFSPKDVPENLVLRPAAMPSSKKKQEEVVQKQHFKEQAKLRMMKEKGFDKADMFWNNVWGKEKDLSSDLRRALDIYGFLFKFSSSSEPNNLDSDIERRPPQNTRAWIRFVTVCSLIRSKKEIFSTAEAEEIVEIIICLFLDRQFLGLLVLLKDCMEAIVNYFTDQEWCSSCENIAKFIACRVSKDLNCIQTIECISEATSRCKQLRSAVAHQTLLSCFHGVNSGEEVLRSLTEINFKDKSCDFYKMFINLVLTENWVLCNSSIEDNPVIYEMFCLYLQNCSTLISATNLRSYASKVRHRASYLLHFSIYK